MKKLHILVLKSYLGPFIMTFFISLFILLMQFLWKYVDDLVGKGLEWYVVGELMFYASSTFVPLALPLAILVSSIMTFGNLAEHNELTAAKTAGVSLGKIMRPLIVVSVCISALAFVFSNYVLPHANLKMGTLLFDVREQKPALNIKEGVFYNEIDGYVIRVNSKERDGQTVNGIMVYDHTNEMGNFGLTVADKGKMVMTEDKKFLLLTLYDGNSYVESRSGSSGAKGNTHPFQRMKYKEQHMRFDLSEFSMERTNEELFKDNYQMLNIKQLNSSIDSIKLLITDRYRYFRNDMMHKYFWYNMYPKKAVATNSIHVKPDIIQNFERGGWNNIYNEAITNMRNNKENMSFFLEDLDNKKKNLNKHEIEWHRKFTLSIACLILFFIGAPLGAIIRKGGFGMPMVVSVIFFISYHILTITGEKMVKEGVVDPMRGMWQPILIILPIGIFLTYKASRDSSLFNIEAYLYYFRAVFKKEKKKIKK
ncbi:MAG: LptF/LptG family permease [Bacteroidota bacterium]